MKYLAGDVFLTRNMGGEENNQTPFSFFNHSAICQSSDVIIEAQEKYGVIRVDIEKFKIRYPAYVVLRVNPDIGLKAASFATTLVGCSYRKIASIFAFPRDSARGENCTSLVRKAYWSALGRDPSWKLPDSIYKDPIFTEIDRKWDNAWTPPANPYDGIIVGK